MPHDDRTTIEVPIFKHTKGGGKKVIGTRVVPVVYRGAEYVTVQLEKYRGTFTNQELRMIQPASELQPEPPSKDEELLKRLAQNLLQPKPARKRRRRGK